MTRKEFIRNSIAMGIGLPFLSSLITSCNKTSITFPKFETDFTGKVLIIGAGAAGMAAGYLLQRYGVDFEIIEASGIYGGRVKRVSGFVDFPIDTGAEWIHTSPKVLAEIINDPTVDGSIDFVNYNPQSFSVYKNGNLSQANFASNYYNEYKFKNTTWYGFFESYIYPHIASKIVYNQPVAKIDSSADQVELTTVDSTVFLADKVIVTVPIKILQQQSIQFTPALSTEKSTAIDNISVGDAIKAFIVFKEKFYPDILGFGGLIKGLTSDNKFFYDAAFRKNSAHNVMGLFTINEPASKYTSHATETDIINAIIAELDDIFDGQASKHYVKHVIQNWSAEPFIQGAYSYNFNGNQEDIVNAIKLPIGNKVFFAGEALTVENQATVHGACESGYSAVEQVLT